MPRLCRCATACTARLAGNTVAPTCAGTPPPPPARTHARTRKQARARARTHAHAQAHAHCPHLGKPSSPLRLRVRNPPPPPAAAGSPHLSSCGGPPPTLHPTHTRGPPLSAPAPPHTNTRGPPPIRPPPPHPPTHTHTTHPYPPRAAARGPLRGAPRTALGMHHRVGAIMSHIGRFRAVAANVSIAQNPCKHCCQCLHPWQRGDGVTSSTSRATSAAANGA